MKINPLTAIDFYKADHRSQYPEGTELVYSNFTPRSNKYAPQSPLSTDHVVVFGLSMVLQDLLEEVWQKGFFDQPLDKVLKAYKRRMDNSLGPDSISTQHIEDLWNQGTLPIAIKALPEGTLCPIGVPMMTIMNTDPKFFWLTNYLESVLSAEMWKPCAVATIAYEYRKVLDYWAEFTGGDSTFVPIQAHDFSFRGMSNMTDAARCGVGHLLSFIGTDSVLAIDAAEDYYHADSDVEVIGVSVPATEHSVMCMGTKDDEIGTFRRLINETYPSGFVSIVSDTWDFWKVLTEYLPTLKEDILARDGKVVIRPDSGDPVRIICGDQLEDYTTTEQAKQLVGYEHHEVANDTINHWAYSANDFYRTDTVCTVRGIAYNVRSTFEYGYNHDREPSITKQTTTISPVELTPEQKGAVQLLWETFGGTFTAKNYKVLNEKIGLIYGDSITLDRCWEIMSRLAAKGFASTNVVLGVGSYTYQHITRDTYGFAMKATYGEVNGEGREIFKDPITDDGTKKSAKGLLRVSHELTLEDCVSWEKEGTGALNCVWLNGFSWLDQTTLSDIRVRLNGESMLFSIPQEEAA